MNRLPQSRFLVVVLVTGLLVGNCAVRAGDPPGPMKAATAVRLEGKLVLDGKLDDAAWTKAPLQTGFELLLNSAKRDPIPPEQQTSFRVLYDDDNLYFGIRCNEPSPDKLVVEAARQHDAAMWSDDDVELFFDPVGDRDQYYQLTINSEGTQVDLYMIEGGNTGKAGWSSAWQTAAFTGPDFWSLEVAIPFALFHNRPAKTWAERWVFSISRTRSVTPGNYYSQFSPGYGYHNIRNFGYLDGIKVDKARFNLYADSPRFRLEPVAGGFRVFPSLQVENRGDSAFSGTLALDIPVPGARGGQAPVSLPVNAKVRIELPPAFVKEQGKWPGIFTAAAANGSPSLVIRFDEWMKYVPLTVRITEPNYRNGIYASQKVEKIKGILAIGMPLDSIKGMTAKVTLTSAVLGPKTVDLAITGAELPFEFAAADLVEGDYRVRAEILKPRPNPKPGESRTVLVEDVETPLRKLPPAPGCEVRADDQGNLIINGSPVFVRGWYGSTAYCVGPSSQVMAQLPRATNFIMGTSAYDTGNFGLYCVADMSRLVDEAKAKLDQPIDDELRARVRAVMAASRFDRNVIGYYISDEPECRGISPYFLESLYRFVAAEDPYRLVLIISRSPAEYIRACDVMCPHPYMNPTVDPDGTRKLGNPIRSIRNNMVEACGANDGSKVIWCMPQCFTYAGPRGDQPTFRESRWFTHSAMASGAKGIVPFIFDGYWNHLENRVAIDAIFAELALLAPAWLARDSATAINPDNPDIDATAKSYRPPGAPRAQIFIVAANQSYTPGKAGFTVPALATNKDARLIVVRENRVVPVQNGQFTDEFDGLGAHVYTTIESLPYMKSLAELEAEIAVALGQAAKDGNILADPKVNWAVGDFAVDRSKRVDLTDGNLASSAWLPWYGDRTQCVLVFDKPVTFARVSIWTASLKDADFDVWDGTAWKTLNSWRDQLQSRLDWTSATPVTGAKFRILAKATRMGTTGPVMPDISELGFYP